MKLYERGIIDGLGMAKEVAQAHISYDKKNELFKKFPAGDQVTSMAGMVHMAIWAMQVELVKQYEAQETHKQSEVSS